MISFKGSQFPKHIILHAVYFYLRYSVSLRDLEEILAERGVVVDHATLNRWVVKFSPLIALEATNCRFVAYGRNLYQSSWAVDVSLSCCRS